MRSLSLAIIRTVSAAPTARATGFRACMRANACSVLQAAAANHRAVERAVPVVPAVLIDAALELFRRYIF